MSQALLILKKDLRHLRWQIVTVYSLVAANVLFSIRRRPFGPESVGSLTTILIVLGFTILISAAVHEETIPGERQFWLTRPYRRSSLLAAKALFVLLCVNLPCFLSDFAITAGRGYDPWNHLLAFIPRQIWFTVFFALPVFLLATVTRSLTELYAAACLALGIYLAFVSYFGQNAERAGAAWGRPLLACVALGLIAAFVLWSQYRLRGTAVSGLALITGLLLVLSVLTFIPETLGLSLQAALTRGPMEPSLALYRYGTPQVALSPQQPWASVRIPIVIENLPPDAGVISEYAAVTLSAPGRQAVSPQPSRLTFVPEWNPRWLTVSVYRDVAEWMLNEPVTVHVSAYFTIVQDGESQPVDSLDSCRSERAFTACELPFWDDRVRGLQYVNPSNGFRSPRYVLRSSSAFFSPLNTSTPSRTELPEHVETAAPIVTTFETRGHVHSEITFPAVHFSRN